MKAVLSLVLVLGSLTTFAQEDQWTPEEIIGTVYVNSPEFSRDGQKVVWMQRKGMEKEDKFVNHLYLARLHPDVDTPKVVQLTRSKESESNPVFSADGESLYFSSTRKKGKTLWKLNLQGGEAEEVKKFDNAFSSLSRLGDSALVFIGEEGKTLYDITYEKDDTKIVEDTAHWNPRRLFTLELKTKKIKRLTENKYRISSYAVSEDGHYLIYQEITSPDYATDGNPKPNYVLLNLEAGSSLPILKGLQNPGATALPRTARDSIFLLKPHLIHSGMAPVSASCITLILRQKTM